MIMLLALLLKILMIAQVATLGGEQGIQTKLNNPFKSN